ncbi:MAG: D-alanine--D-alanine ligase [Candidatus Omnitrophica bacterium]|nr:D-alanine--D-alanine ligase [Candidatus Omnitrophota bacterium]
MKIGITYNLKDELSPDAIIDTESCEEFDSPLTIDAICGVFEKNGHEIVKLGCGIKIIERLRGEKVDFVFNIAEGCRGRNRESHTPSILEMLDIPYSGSDPLTLGLTLDKVVTKKIAFQAGIPTPRYLVIKTSEDLLFLENKLVYPLITKPAWEGSSKGIYNSSKVFNRQELEKSAELLFKKYPDQPLLAEEYVEGREITAGVIGNEPPRVLGLMEIVNRAGPEEDIFYSLDTKRDWKKLVDYASPPDIEQLIQKHISHYALMAFKEFGCKDVARIDFKISKNNKIFMLEVNPLPGLSPEYADLVIMARKNGIKYDDLILSIFNHALLRYRSGKGDLSYETV